MTPVFFPVIRPMHSLNAKGRLLLIEKPMVMGILNATPDSFHENSRVSLQEVVDKAGNMLDEGAAILDIGGQSTRPGAEQVGAAIEAERCIPAIESVRSAFPQCWISVDTYHAAVASQALEAGADIVNDVSAGDEDADMLPLVARAKAPFIAMHKKGTPETMQLNPHYQNVVSEVLDYFKHKKAQFETMGIYDWVLDPGFGFGKSLEHNYKLMRNLESLAILDRPIMVGISRKGMIQRALNVDAGGALNGTTALHMFALIKGATILRVHDVREATECIKLSEMLKHS